MAKDGENVFILRIKNEEKKCVSRRRTLGSRDFRICYSLTLHREPCLSLEPISKKNLINGKFQKLFPKLTTAKARWIQIEKSKNLTICSLFVMPDALSLLTIVWETRLFQYSVKSRPVFPTQVTLWCENILIFTKTHALGLKWHYCFYCLIL